MTRSAIFWLLMILWLLSILGGVWVHWPKDSTLWVGHAGTLFEFLLFGLLGWEVYGPAVKGK